MVVCSGNKQDWNKDDREFYSQHVKFEVGIQVDISNRLLDI